MMGVFAAAVARLTPAFVESFDPEKLASKFVRVEKEFGVKFTKSNSTFNIVGHWEAVRKAHKSLLKLKFNEKVTENSSESVDIKADISGTKITPLSKSGNVPDEYNNVEVPQTSETEQITEKEPLLVRGKGNPKRGRHAAKESPYSGVPEPVFYLQYQDKTFADACSLDIDSVLEDFEKSHNNTKVTKEELKKILEKNKDQMGKPLEKGIPKGAILPVAKVTEDNCETFAVEDMLNPIPPSTRMPSDVPQGYGYGMPGCSKENTISFMSNGQPLLCSSGAMNMEMANQFNTSMVTTYTVNSKMTTQSPGLVPCINKAINQNSTTSGHLNVSDFYNHTDVKNGRVHVNEAVFSENQYNVNNTRPVQLSDSDSDSFSSMFGDYDPQAMLNQIPASEMMGNITEVTDKRLQEVDTKLARNDKELQAEAVSNNDNESKQRNFQNSEELETSFNPPEVANDGIPCESNGIKMEMHDFKDGTASFEDFTDLPVGSKTFTAKDFSCIVLHDSENNSAINNTNTDIISMATKAEHDNVGIPNAGPPSHHINSNNTVVSNNQMIQNNPSDFLKSMPTGEEFMKSLEVATATENQSVLYSNEHSAGQASFQNSADALDKKIAHSDRSTVAMTTQVVTIATNFKGQQVYGNAASDHSAVFSNNNNMNPQAESTFERFVPVHEGNMINNDVPDTRNGGNIHDAENISQDEGKKEQDQDSVGKKTSQLKVKKSRPSVKRVRKKPSEKLEKHNRGKKPITSDVKGLEERTARKDGSTSDGKEEPMRTDAEKLDLNSIKLDSSYNKDLVNKLDKISEVKLTSEVKGKQIYKCTECDYQGYRKKRLSEHMGRVHGLLPNGSLPENPMFSCDECEKTFVFEKDLSRHKKIVHHGQVFVCLVCNKNYKSKYVYDRHTATHAEGYVQPKFKCQICEQEFTTKFSLSSHIKSKHLGVKKTYSCPTCGKTFSQIRSYRQHANVHAGIRPYTCEVCGKSFTYDKSLKEHRYMHDTVRRFQCTVCQKAFRQQTCLLIHMKTHKDKKDHICSVCGREFTQKQSLLRHERIHTGDKPYSCKLCFKSFGDYAVIRKHIMMAHKADKDGWKQFALTTESKRSNHYIDGGPGYVPRESYAKINEKPQENVTTPILHFGQDAINQRLQPGTDVVMPGNEMIPLPEMYQMPSYTANLDFCILSNGSPSQIKQENSVLDIKHSAVSSVEPDLFGNINTQQHNLTMKAYLSNLTANTLTKMAETGEDKYVTQFQNSSDLVNNVAVEKSSAPSFAVKDELLSSSVSVTNCDAVTTCGSLVTVAPACNSWTYPAYSSAYFSPSSFSPYQNSADTPQ